MADPYQVFGLPPTADQAAIRRRYLELVRQHPPERSPERFAEISAAYDQLRDPIRRLEAALLKGTVHDSMEDIMADAAGLAYRKLTLDSLLALGEE